MRIRYLWGNLKLKNKFAFASIFIVLLSTTLLALVFLKYASNQITNTEYSNAEDMSAQIGNYFDEKYRSLLQRVFALRSDDMFNNNSFMAKFLLNKDTYYHAAALSQLSGVLSEIRMSESFINSVYIYTPKGDFYDLAKPRKPGIDFNDTKLYAEIKKLPNINVYWGEKRTNEIYSDNSEVIPIVIPFNVDGYDESCYIIVNLDVAEITKYLKTVYSEGEGSVVILTNDGQTLSGYFDNVDPMSVRDESLMRAVKSSETGTLSMDVMHDKYIVAYYKTKVTPCRVVILKSQKYLTRNLDQVKSFLFMLTCISIGMCIFIALLVSKSITKPLDSLESTIKKVTNKNFDAKFTYRYNDEVGQLGKNFNFMLNQIKELIDKLNATIQDLNEEKVKVKEEQILKRKAELKTLQAQINPHFLYNTLNSITWMADSVNENDISLMAAKLGKMYQISLSGGKEFISIKEELEHVTSYLFIQKIRYSDKLNYDIQVSDEILRKMTIKLILQPFVENSIYHGIKESNRYGTILIKGRLSRNRENIEIFIIDDGTGMNNDQVKTLNRQLKKRMSVEQGGYGIYNVNERIKLYFGEKYGIRLYSRPGRITVAKVYIPTVNPEGYDEICLR